MVILVRTDTAISLENTLISVYANVDFQNLAFEYYNKKSNYFISILEKLSSQSYPLCIHKKFVNYNTSRPSSGTKDWYFWLFQKGIYKSDSTEKVGGNISAKEKSFYADCLKKNNTGILNTESSQPRFTFNRKFSIDILKKWFRLFYLWLKIFLVINSL